MTHTPIGRREFVTLLGAGAAMSSGAWPLAAQQRNVPVIGWLSSRSAATDALVQPAFHKALNAQGFVEGRNVTVEYRYADAQVERLPALAADLVRRRATVIVVVGDTRRAIRAVQAASATMRIVGILASDPITEGWVTSINRPGGNITGVITFRTAMAGKRLGLLHDLLPRAATISVLVNPTEDGTQQQIKDVQDAAFQLGL